MHRQHSLKMFTPLSIPTGFTLIVLLFLSSCGSVQHTDMLMFDDVLQEISEVERVSPLIIQSDDILSIQVTSRNPETVIAFQMRIAQGNTSAAGEGALGTQEGYRVDEEGNIYLPFIGKVEAAGKRILDLRREITDSLIDFIPDASVQMRFMNFRVTVLGEVNRPNTYIIPNERLTVLEAIGMAGDFSPYANRSEVLLIRERNEIREFARINTQNKELFLSPYFYLSPNDILYVEPLKARQYATRGDFFDRYGILFFPVVSLITFLVGLGIN